MNISLILKGFAMGIAEVIPGVSGGTIAFITGIYERLLDAIKSFNPSLIKTFKESGIKGVWTAIHGNFLVLLLLGMGIGLGGGAFGITYLLENFPPVVWAFFFGLILSSVIYIGKKVSHWTWDIWLLLIVGTLVAYYITVATPAQGSEHPLMIFVAGFIAISALILPGISGSFMLLLMGMYTFVIGSVKGAIQTQSWEYIQVFLFFGIGALLGLLIFSRVLSWLFGHYRNQTLALLTGFMMGSLNKIWPWRNVLTTRINSKGVEVPLTESNVMPAGFEGDPLVLGVVISAIVGFALVFVLAKFEKEGD